MNLKRSPFAIQDKNARDLDNAKDFPTIADLMREQKVQKNDDNKVNFKISGSKETGIQINN